MKIENIKFIPIYIRYVLPLLEFAALLLFDQILQGMVISQQITPMEAYNWYKKIVLTMSFVCLLLVWRYKNTASILIQLLVIFIIYASIMLNSASNYAVPH